MLLLHLLRENEGPAVLADPPLYGVDLVEGDDERGLVLPQNADGLDRLRHQTFFDIYNQNGEVREGAASGTQCDEGLMARRIDEEKTGNIELLGAYQLPAHLVYVLYRNLRGSDVLGDGAGLPGLHRGAPDTVEKLRLAVIHMTQNADYRLPYGHKRHL